MSDDALSQEEIAALLKGMGPDGEKNSLRVEDYLDSFTQDTLGEIGNISFGSSATALSKLLGQKVEITTPTIGIVERGQLEKEFSHPYVAVQVQYTEGLVGENLLVIQQSDAAIIADLMLGGDGTNTSGEAIDHIHLSAVQEAMNQMMGSAATSMSTVFDKRVDISPPSVELLDVAVNKSAAPIPEEGLLVKISFRLTVGELIDSEIMQLLPLAFSQRLVNQLTGGAKEASGHKELVRSASPSRMPEEALDTVPPASKPARLEVPVQKAQFTQFEEVQLNKTEASNLNMLLDIPLSVTVELGRTQRSVKEILELTGGSIIELDKMAGEPVDILVNNRLIAKGEVVVIDESFGVRITDISSQADRLNNLK